MISSQSSDANQPYYDTRMPEPEIPTRQTPWFTKALWALALLLVVGMVYSFLAHLERALTAAGRSARSID